jgi:hypothetical protein
MWKRNDIIEQFAEEDPYKLKGAVHPSVAKKEKQPPNIFNDKMLKINSL